MSTDERRNDEVVQESSAEENLSRAADAVAAGDWALAETLAGRAYESGARSPDCLEVLGACRSRRGDHRSAAGLFAELVELLTPGFASALAALGHEKRLLGQLD